MFMQFNGSLSDFIKLVTQSFTAQGQNNVTISANLDFGQVDWKASEYPVNLPPAHRDSFDAAVKAEQPNLIARIKAVRASVWETTDPAKVALKDLKGAKEFVERWSNEIEKAAKANLKPADQ